MCSLWGDMCVMGSPCVWHRCVICYICGVLYVVLVCASSVCVHVHLCICDGQGWLYSTQGLGEKLTLFTGLRPRT